MGMVGQETLVELIQEQLRAHGYAHGTFESIDQAIVATGLPRNDLDHLRAVRTRLYTEDTASGLLWDTNFLRASEFYEGGTRQMSNRPTMIHSAGISNIIDEQRAKAIAQSQATKADIIDLHPIEIAVPTHDFVEDIASKRTKEVMQAQPDAKQPFVRASIRSNELNKLRQFYETISAKLSTYEAVSTDELSRMWLPSLMIEGLITRGSFSATWQKNDYFTYMVGMDSQKVIAGERTRMKDNVYTNILKNADFIDNIPDLYPTTSYLMRRNLIDDLPLAESLEECISPQYIRDARRILEKATPDEYEMLKLGFRVRNPELVKGFRSLGLDVRDAAGRVENIMWATLRNDRGYYWTRRVASLDARQRQQTDISDVALHLLYNISMSLSETIQPVSRLDKDHHFVYNKIHREKAHEIERQVDEYMLTPESRRFTKHNPDSLAEHLHKYDSFTKLAIDIVDNDSDTSLGNEAQYRALCMSDRLSTRYREENADMLTTDEFTQISHIEGSMEAAAYADR